MTAEYIRSAPYIPDRLSRESDLSNFRYIPDLSSDTRSTILQLMNDTSISEEVRSILPHKEESGEFRPGDPEGLLAMIMKYDRDSMRSYVTSRLIDQGLTEVLQNGVLIVRSAIREDALQVFENSKPNKVVMYESMPTNVFADVTGGNSLAVISIKDGDPEVTSLSHSHNGSRLVTALTEPASLVLPSGTHILARGDAVWMDPWTQHSFQQGSFLAAHTSEAGWDHEDAFNPL